MIVKMENLMKFVLLMVILVLVGKYGVNPAQAGRDSGFTVIGSLQFEATNLIPIFKTPRIGGKVQYASVENDEITRLRTFEEKISGVNRDGHFTETGRSMTEISNAVVKLEDGDSVYGVELGIFFQLFSGSNISSEFVGFAGNKTIQVGGGVGYDSKLNLYAVGDFRVPYVRIGGKVYGRPINEEGTQVVPFVEVTTQGKYYNDTDVKYLNDVVVTKRDTRRITTPKPIAVKSTPVVAPVTIKGTPVATVADGPHDGGSGFGAPSGVTIVEEPTTITCPSGTVIPVNETCSTTVWDEGAGDWDDAPPMGI